MTDHDPLCEFVTMAGALGGITCHCSLIAKVRADEREKIAQTIEAKRDRWQQRMDAFAYTDAAQIARNGGRDE